MAVSTYWCVGYKNTEDFLLSSVRNIRGIKLGWLVSIRAI